MQRFAHDAFVGIRGGIGDELWDVVICTVGQYNGATEAAAEKTQEGAGVRMTLHGSDGMIKIGTTCCQGGDGIEIALALAASAVIEA